MPELAVASARKRPLEEAENPPKNTPFATRAAAFPPQNAVKNGPRDSFKRARNQRIYGQKLPVSRVVEVLDHASLQALFQAVVTHHPEIANTVALLAPRPAVAQSVELIQNKARAIRQAVPYKCDADSDYSYVRVKPYLTEFLHCISDFVLDLLPPQRTDIRDLCLVINVITNMLHELPDFKSKEFQYTRAMAYEQIAHSWLILLQHKDEEDEAQRNIKSVEFAKVVEELHLVDALLDHDERSLGKFSAVVDYVRTEMGAISELPPSLVLSDLITVNYSNYSISARTSH